MRKGLVVFPPGPFLVLGSERVGANRAESEQSRGAGFSVTHRQVTGREAGLVYLYFITLEDLKMRKYTVLSMLLAALLFSSESAMGALSHYWAFDTDATDAVSGGLDGTIVGSGATISNVTGEYQRGSGALKIAPTGSGDYVRIDSAAIPTYSPMAYTISTWFKFDETLGVAPTSGRNFIWESTPNWTASIEARPDNTLSWYMAGTPNISQSAQSPSINDGQWHHVAIVYDSPNSVVSYYYDGSLGNMVGANELLQPTDGLNIGEHRGGDGSRNWQGYIDDFAIFNGTLNDAGVAGLYSGTYTPLTVPVTDGPAPPAQIPTAPLAAYWTFDNDYSSEVHNDFYEGTPQGGAYTSITNVAGDFHEGSGALKLDSGDSSGNGTFVDIARAVALPERDRQVSVSAWYKASDISGDGSDDRNFVWESSPGYSLSFSVGSNDTANWAYQGIAADENGPAVAMDEWNHVVMVLDMDAERMQFYHNGELYDDLPTNGNEIPAMEGFHIGNHRDGNGARDFDGFIDDVAVFHGVLSPEAVAELYNGTSTPQTVTVSDGVADYALAEAVEAGCSLTRVIDFENPAGVAINSSDGKLYVGSRLAIAAEGEPDAGGVYEIATDGTATLVVGYSLPVSVLVDSADGDLFVATDFAGDIDRVASGTTVLEPWTDGLREGDDDPTGMAIVPDNYTGGLVSAGSILLTDRGSGGYEELWVLSPDTAGGEYALVSDADADDGVGNVIFDLLDVAVNNSQIFVVDGVAGKIFEVTAADTLSELVLSETIDAPRSIVFDPATDDLLALCSDGLEGQVLRINTASGDVSLVIDGLAVSSFTNWGTLGISADGSQLFVTDYVTDRIYEFALEAAPRLAGDANRDGVVDDADAAVLASNWQTTSGANWAMGDFNGDGAVNDADATLLATNWQSSAASASVPEPGSVVMLLAMLLVAICGCRYRR